MISQKTRAAGSVDLQAVVQFPDPILGITSAAVDLVNILRFVREIRDHKAVIVPGVATGTSHDLGFDDDTASMWPFPRCIACFAEEGFGLAGLAQFHSDFSHQAASSLYQSGVSGHPHQVLNASNLR